MVADYFITNDLKIYLQQQVDFEKNEKNVFSLIEHFEMIGADILVGDCIIYIELHSIFPIPPNILSIIRRHSPNFRTAEEIKAAKLKEEEEEKEKAKEIVELEVE